MTNKLWAPWRSAYVTRLDHKARGCIFCKLEREKKDNDNYIFIREKHSYAVLNIYPYNNGHVLIVPFKHVNDIIRLTQKEKDNLFYLCELVKSLLEEILKPDGYNIGMNIGRAAGAGVPGHIHLHLVPRWKGDANFMAVVGNTRVISRALKELYKKLRHAYSKRH